MRTMRSAWSLVRETYTEWTADGAPRLAAALAYYTAFSIGPLLILIIAVAGALFGDEAVRGQVAAQMDGLIGADGARMLEEMIENAAAERSGIFATTVSVVALLLGATGVFGELQAMMNTIWDVDRPVTAGGIGGMLRTRLLSFGMILGIAFLLLVSLVVSAVIAAASGWSRALLPGMDALWHLVDVAVSLAVTTALFAMIFKFLPDTVIAWRDVVSGAFVTAVLFTLGKLAIGFYLGRSSVASVYGAAGSLAVLLVWIYYAAQILFFGAELTQVYAKRHGTRVASASGGEMEQSPPFRRPAASETS
jgi:membrane protein